MAAVNGAVAGGIITKAEKETKGGVVIYDVKATTSKGKKYEVEVQADGKVIKSEAKFWIADCGFWIERRD